MTPSRHPADDRHAGEYWVFGYGSLMWRPGFPFDRAEPGLLVGFHRAFCIYSTNHRGDDRRPGLVLGLDRGGVCHGVAYRVPREHADWTRRYLAAREQVNGVYREERVRIEIADGEVLAHAYVVERAHPSYTGRLPVALQARLIRAAKGRSGCNLDYLLNSLEEFARRSILERELARVGVMAGPLFARPLRSHSGVRPGVAALRRTVWRSWPFPPVMPRHQRRRFQFRRALSAR